jgi:hypothetical protein
VKYKGQSKGLVYFALNEKGEKVTNPLNPLLENRLVWIVCKIISNNLKRKWKTEPQRILKKT